jgi:hypothetical protein
VFSEPFSHYLSYGATDQETVRELAGAYTGLLVPGTIAAFQREGTGGFVLSLSATEEGIPYVIDPRFPLFQQHIVVPKKSHESLAQILGLPSSLYLSTPEESEFTDELIEDVAKKWVDFNLGYRTSASGKFDKYARRLKEEVQEARADNPRYLLAPYLMSRGRSDPWWQKSCALFKATRRFAANSAVPVLRVVAAVEARFLEDLLSSIPDTELAIWVSGLDELTTSAFTLAEYADAIGKATERGQALFALYGGFFSVLLSSKGLRGVSHGIGFGESRVWIELPTSGPPPPRYYLRQVHRYVPQELAYQLWLKDRALARCECSECRGGSPIELEYHSLMKHSVLCRSQEIGAWVGLTEKEMAHRLDREEHDFRTRLEAIQLPDQARAAAVKSYSHLAVWSEALRMQAGP